MFTARKRAGLTQAQLAAAIGCDRPWLRDLETAKLTFITDDDACNLAARLPLETAELDSLRSGSGSRRRALLGGPWSPPIEYCTACGHPREPGARYCGACGIAMPSEIVCSTCGHPNASVSDFCTQCGGQLGQVSGRP